MKNNYSGDPMYFDVAVTAVPAPGTCAMMMAGLVAVGALARRRRAMAA